MHKTGRPVLVGTTSVEQSESLSKQLTEASIPHQVTVFFFFFYGGVLNVILEERLDGVCLAVFY